MKDRQSLFGQLGNVVSACGGMGGGRATGFAQRLPVSEQEMADAKSAGIRDSPKLEVGERVVVIGNPLGLEGTVLDRVVFFDKFQDFFRPLPFHIESESGTGVSSRSLLCPLQGCNPNTNDREKKEDLYVSANSGHKSNSIPQKFDQRAAIAARFTA